MTLKPIEFRVWDASTGIVRALCTAHHPTIHDAAGTFLPTTNGHGSMFQPLRIKAGTGVQTQTTLTPGWNWVSFNIEPEASEDYMQSMFSGIQNTDIVQIKSHNLAETFFSSGVWQPNASRIDVNARYEVKMATANPDAEWTLSNLGNAANEDATIKQGWNDIGFMPQQPMSTEVTLRSLADAEVLQPNDLIASRYEGFALYAGDGEWVGSLTTMRPGQGYRLRVGTPDPNNAPTLGTLEWPEIPTFINPNWLHHNPLTGVSRPDDAWSMNVQDCPDMMTIVARTVLPSDQSPSPGDHLGAFILDADGEPVCIGQALPKMTDNGICHFLSSTVATVRIPHSTSSGSRASPEKNWTHWRSSPSKHPAWQAHFRSPSSSPSRSGGTDAGARTSCGLSESVPRTDHRVLARHGARGKPDRARRQWPIDQPVELQRNQRWTLHLGDR